MIGDQWRPLLTQAAGCLGLPPGPLTVDSSPDELPSRLPAADTAVACVATALTAAAALQHQRGGPQPHVRLNAAYVTAAMRSEAHLRVNGQGVGSGFAPLSRFWRAADGWVRTHGNYPWHRDALLRALGTGDDPDVVGAAIGERPAEAVETDVTAAGGVAAAVRSAAQWCPESAELATPSLGGGVPTSRPPPGPADARTSRVTCVRGPGEITGAGAAGQTRAAAPVRIRR